MCGGRYSEPMTMRLELHVSYSDGTGRIERVERDDPAGRRSIDRAAFAALQRPNVATVSAHPTLRTASTGGRGRYR